MRALGDVGGDWPRGTVVCYGVPEMATGLRIPVGVLRKRPFHKLCEILARSGLPSFALRQVIRDEIFVTKGGAWKATGQVAAASQRLPHSSAESSWRSMPSARAIASSRRKRSAKATARPRRASSGFTRS